MVAGGGAEAVRYFPEMRVLHLEVATVRDFLNKSYLYGKSWRKYSQIVDARPVGNAERMKIWAHVVEEEALSLPQRVRMWAVLGLGAISFKWGAIRGRGSNDLPQVSESVQSKHEERASHG